MTFIEVGFIEIGVGIRTGTGIDIKHGNFL